VEEIFFSTQLKHKKMFSLSSSFIWDDANGIRFRSTHTHLDIFTYPSWKIFQKAHFLRSSAISKCFSLPLLLKTTLFRDGKVLKVNKAEN
jgi:hypothetical protein